MTTTDKSKKKRGRPKKVQAKPAVEAKIEPIAPDVELNEVFNSNIYFYNGEYIKHAGCFVFHLPSKDMELNLMREEQIPPSWHDLQITLRAGIYPFEDVVTGATGQHVLGSENPHVWIENIEKAVIRFPHGVYTFKELSQRYET